MLEKLALIPEVDEFGFEHVVPFGAHGNGLEKLASLPEGAQRYAEKFVPKNGELGLMIVGMGATEAWSSNSNADGFSEKALLHYPADWSDDPERDRVISAKWPWGIPTFYSAKIYAHHANKNREKSIGEVGYVTWDPKMLWVLLAVIIDPEKAKKFSGEWILDRISQGRPIPWSMGCRVPFDLLSTTPDWAHYDKAVASYDPAKHKLPADAVLHYHDKVHHIHGLARTRKDYTNEMLFHANEVHPDGTKTYVDNPFPWFFDMSGVGVGADPTAWSLFKLGSKCALVGSHCSGGCTGGVSCNKYVLPGAVLEERFDMLMDKAASLRTASLGKGAVVRKNSEIDKEVTSPLQGSTSLKNIRKDEDSDGDDEPGLPPELLNLMGERKPLDKALSTPTCMGMVLKPREFRRVVLVRLGRRSMADKLDGEHKGLPVSLDEESPATLSSDAFDDDLARLLVPLIGKRSWLGPVAVKKINVTIVRSHPVEDEDAVQRKVAALYNGYRRQAAALVERAPHVMSKRSGLRAALYGFGDLAKHGVAQISGTLSPLVTSRTREYFRSAYL